MRQRRRGALRLDQLERSILPRKAGNLQDNEARESGSKHSVAVTQAADSARQLASETPISENRSEAYSGGMATEESASNTSLQAFDSDRGGDKQNSLDLGTTGCVARGESTDVARAPERQFAQERYPIHNLLCRETKLPPL